MAAIILVATTAIITTAIVRGVNRAGGFDSYLHGVASAIYGRVAE